MIGSNAQGNRLDRALLAVYDVSREWTRKTHPRRQPRMAENELYYGDNLEILRDYIEDESVDLVYLDPPFKSQQNYNVLFEERSGDLSSAQIQAFEDTWTWDLTSARTYAEVVEQAGEVSRVMQAFRTFLGESDMLAYLSMMAPRLVELQRVLKETGSLYLHCDPTASHYLKMLLDAVFGPTNFQNEVIWKRTSAHSSANRYGPVHDVLLFYSRSDEMKWVGGHQAYDQEYIDRRFREDDAGRLFKDADLTGSGIRHGETGKEWRGLNPTEKGRHWAYPPDRLEELDAEGRVYWPKKEGGWPRLKQFLDEMSGRPLQDVWTDIPPINSQARERLGYPTQKPEALLERIIDASSQDGDVVLDPFCGCGTTITAAQRMDRQWIGIDITHLAITLIKHRLRDAYGDDAEFDVVGEPITLSGAEKLAEEDRFQFEWWALGLVGARPQEQKKGADQGIDGRLYFHDSPNADTRQIIIQVKSGKTGVSHIRDLKGVVQREDAEIGVLITLQEPTKPMKKEAAGAGFYDSPWGKHPKIQILTVEELLEGAEIDYPPITGSNVTYKKAPKYEKKVAEQLNLTDGD